MTDQPKRPGLFFDIHVFCCINERPLENTLGSCATSGSVDLHDYMKTRAKELGIGRIRVNKSGCLARCKSGPVMVIYPEGVWYSYKTKADINEILDSHIIGNGRVDRLLIDT
ncbi:MAG: (2Fe-2S) ferredoxin domain-containing protein [Rhodospirillaceae bacterium]|nr:(2Fe-2S) ferredoxin domain-containing protein [Rhodospirillaceae bacterium]